jgi:hypothetical protein
MLKITFILVKPWLNRSRCVLSWSTASLFGNNFWIMGCIWLPNLSTYSLAAIRLWRVIMGPTEYCTMILLPKSSQNLPRVPVLEPNQEFRIVGFLRCSSNVNSSWCREQREGRLIWPCARFQLSDAQVLWLCTGLIVVTPSFTHLSITFSNERFSNCSPTVDVWFVKLTSDSFYGNRVFKINIQVCCHLRCTNSPIFRNNPSQCMTISFCQCWFSLTVFLRLYCLPLILVMPT